MRNEKEIKMKIKQLEDLITPGNPRYESGETKGFKATMIASEIEILQWVLGIKDKLPFE